MNSRLLFFSLEVCKGAIFFILESHLEVYISLRQSDLCLCFALSYAETKFTQVLPMQLFTR